MLLRTSLGQRCLCPSGLNTQEHHQNQTRRLETAQPCCALGITVLRRPKQGLLGSNSGPALSRSNISRPHIRSLTVRTTATVMGGAVEIVGEEDFATLVNSQEVVVVDWMAKWCRKCIYLKPKLEKLIDTEFPQVPLGFVDVNAVPSTLIRGNGISKMPTIAVYRRGEKVVEHIAAEGGLDALEPIRRMLKKVLAEAASAAPADAGDQPSIP